MGMLVDVSKGTGLYTILQFDGCDFLHMPDWTGKSHEAPTLHKELQTTEECQEWEGWFSLGRAQQLVVQYQQT